MVSFEEDILIVAVKLFSDYDNKTHSDVRKAEMRWKIGVNKERREDRRKWSELSTVWCGSEWYVERHFHFYIYAYAYKGAFLLLKTHTWERRGKKMKSTVLYFYVCLPFKVVIFLFAFGIRHLKVFKMKRQCGNTSLKCLNQP